MVKRKKTLVVQSYEEEKVYEVISDMMKSRLWEDEEYRALAEEIERVCRAFPKVKNVYNERTALDLSGEEVEALLRVMDLRGDMSRVEQRILVEEAQGRMWELFWERAQKSRFD